MREREGKGRGAADDLTLRVVLRSVAGALELVLGGVPGNDAAQVRAHGVEAELLDARVRDDEVGGVTLQIAALSGPGACRHSVVGVDNSQCWPR